MGNFANNAITESGRVLLADVQAGAVFIPTKIVIGSGNIPAGKTPATMTDVVTVVKNLGINKKERTPDGKCIIGGVYTNEDIATDFYFRELALYARAEYRDEEGNVTQEVSERLYSYGNAGNTADLMPAYSTSTAVEKQLDLVIWIGNDAKVDLTIASGLYIPFSEKGAPGGVAALDDTGRLNLEKGLNVDGGLGTVGANSNMAVLAHHLEKGGLSRYVAVSMENPLETALCMNEELEGGGAKSYTILHTGLANPSGMIGAFPVTKLLTANPDANNLTTEGNYFLLNGRNIPKSHGFVTVLYFDGNSFAPDLAWGKTLCVRQIFRDYNSAMICERIGLLKMEISNEWEWGAWSEIPSTAKNIVLNVPANGGYRIKNSDTGAATDFMAGRGYSVMRIMDTFDDNNNYREIMLVGANASPSVANSLRLLDVSNGQGVSYEVIHEGNIGQYAANLAPATVE